MMTTNEELISRIQQLEAKLKSVNIQLATCLIESLSEFKESDSAMWDEFVEQNQDALDRLRRIIQ